MVAVSDRWMLMSQPQSTAAQRGRRQTMNEKLFELFQLMAQYFFHMDAVGSSSMDIKIVRLQ
jgi:hypothetical protein